MKPAKNNYALQVKQALAHFLTYDSEMLAAKFGIPTDADYLYPTFMGIPYRLNHHRAQLQRREDGVWVDAENFGETMTLLDILCDSREDRFLSGELQSMQNFGNLVHSSLLAPTRDPLAEAFDRDPDALRRAAEALGATPDPVGDMGYRFELMDGLAVVLRFWHSDEDFPASIVWFWDKNALQYLRYETMFFAVVLIKERLEAAMYRQTASV